MEVYATLSLMDLIELVSLRKQGMDPHSSSLGMLVSDSPPGYRSQRVDDLAEELLQLFLKRSETVWICVCKIRRGSTTTFDSYPHGISTVPHPSVLRSFRRILGGNTGSALGFALNHELLVEYVVGQVKQSCEVCKGFFIH